jgi:hypothetical protein
MSAHIPTWQERRQAGSSTERAMLDHIADLRARIAELEAAQPVAWGVVRKDGKLVHTALFKGNSESYLRHANENWLEHGEGCRMVGLTIVDAIQPTGQAATTASASYECKCGKELNVCLATSCEHFDLAHDLLGKDAMLLWKERALKAEAAQAAHAGAEEAILTSAQQRMWTALDRKACPGVWMQIASDAVLGFKKDSYGDVIPAAPATEKGKP